MKSIWKKSKNKRQSSVYQSDPKTPGHSSSSYSLATNREEISTHTSEAETETDANHDPSALTHNEEESVLSDTSPVDSETELEKPMRETMNVSYREPNAQQKQTFKSFVRPDWDDTVIKAGWVNRGCKDRSGEEGMRLFLMVLRGSTLTLYKPPPEMSSLKHFTVERPDDQGDDSATVADVTFEDRSSEQPTNSTSTTTFYKHENISKTSMSQTSTESLYQRAPPQSLSVDLKYLSPLYPHPGLVIEPSTNAISKGSLESICHSILFHPGECEENLSVITSLIQLLPLLADIENGLAVFIAYSDSFIKSYADKSFSGKTRIDMDEKRVMTSRLLLVVECISENYPGMLLDELIFRKIWELLLSIDMHENSDDLKQKIHKKRQEVFSLLTPVGLSSLPRETNVMEDLSAAKFLSLDTESLAVSINSIALRFAEVWNPEKDYSLLFQSVQNTYTYHRRNPLVFDRVSNVHYLGRLLKFHLFEDPEGSRTPSSRAQMLSKWIKLGSLFDKMGDMVSWLAIATLILSYPILRLSKTWQCVDSSVISHVSTNWAPIVFELERRDMTNNTNKRSSYHVIAPQGIGELYSTEDVIPYLGDLNVDASKDLTIKQCEKHYQRVTISFKRWKEYLGKVVNNAPRRQEQDGSSHADGRVVLSLYKLLDLHARSEDLTLESVMNKSLLVESRSEKQLYKIHDSSRTPLFLGSYAPVIFTGALPRYQIYSERALLGALGNLNSPESEVLNKIMVKQVNVLRDSEQKETGSLSEAETPLPVKATGRTQFLKTLRDMLNIGSIDLPANELIIFKATGGLDSKPDPTKDETVPPSPSSSKPCSRPSSVLFGDSANMKRFSNFSFSDFSLDLDRRASKLSNQPRTEKKQNKNHAIEICVKAASLEKLLDLLVLTSSVFTSEIEPDAIRSLLPDQSYPEVSLKMDSGVFTIVFLSTYRSFCSSTTLLEGLKKRCFGSKSAAASIIESTAAAKTDDHFPNWDVTGDQPRKRNDILYWVYAAQIELGVLEAFCALVKDHYGHLVEDLPNKKLCVDILRFFDQQCAIEWPKTLNELEASNQDISEVHSLYSSVLSLYKKVRKLYIKNTYKPSCRSVPLTLPSENVKIPAGFSLPLASDTNELETFVDECDKVAGILFEEATVDDWLTVFEIIEYQASCSLTGLFNYDMQKPTSSDNLKLSNVFEWLSSLRDCKGYNRVLDELPSSVKATFTFYRKMNFLFVSQLTDPLISKETRCERMQSILMIISTSRLKMSSLDLFNSEEIDSDVSPHVPSLVETAAVHAVTSPQSRAFTHCWVSASSKLKGSSVTEDSLEALLPSTRDFSSSITRFQPLAPCAGWFIERLIEIACYIPNMSVENTNLINFDKRRFVYNCVTNIMDLCREYHEVGVSTTDSLNKCSLFFLLTLKEVAADLRQIKEEANRENKDHSREHGIKQCALFSDALNLQGKILKSELAKKNFLSSQEQHHQALSRQSGATDIQKSRTISRKGSERSLSSKASQSFRDRPIRPLGNNIDEGKSASGSSRFRLSGFFGKRRPFSMGLTSLASSTADKVVDASQLPDPLLYVDGGLKLCFKLDLRWSTVFSVYASPASFKVSKGHEEEHTLQANSDQDKDDWIYKIGFSKKHWFFSRQLNSESSDKAVFGIPLDYVCMREGRPVPAVVEKFFAEVEMRGLEEVGIYRKSASVSILNVLRKKIDSLGDFNMEHQLVFDINNVTGCLKLYLRELPDPLIPEQLVPRFSLVKDAHKDTDHRFRLYQELLSEMPYHSYQLLRRLIFHLKVIDEYREYNRMNASNLAVIMGTTFSEGINPYLSRKYFGVMNFLCEDMIRNFDLIFGST